MSVGACADGFLEKTSNSQELANTGDTVTAVHDRIVFFNAIANGGKSHNKEFNTQAHLSPALFDAKDCSSPAKEFNSQTS
eukprot:7506953-Karenia_brevis.AAC.1